MKLLPIWVGQFANENIKKIEEMNSQALVFFSTSWLILNLFDIIKYFVSITRKKELQQFYFLLTKKKKIACKKQT